MLLGFCVSDHERLQDPDLSPLPKGGNDDNLQRRMRTDLLPRAVGQFNVMQLLSRAWPQSQDTSIFQLSLDLMSNSGGRG